MSGRGGDPTLVGGGHCLAPSRTVDAPVEGAAGLYTRLFPELPAIEEDNAALLALGSASCLPRRLRLVASP